MILVVMLPCFQHDPTPNVSFPSQGGSSGVSSLEVELLPSGIAAGHSQPMVYPWCPRCSFMGVTKVDLAGVCQHLTYRWYDPLPVVDVSVGSPGGSVAIHAMLGG